MQNQIRQKLDMEFLNGESTGQTVWTTLTHDQNRDAIAAVNMLKRSGSDKALTFVVEYFLRNYSEPAENLTVRAASDIYVQEKKKEHKRGMISALQASCISIEMARFVEEFGEQPVNEVRPLEIRDFLEKTTRPGKGKRFPP